MVSALDRGREGYARRSWEEAYRELSRAGLDNPLVVDDLERLAVAAYLSGNDASADAWERGYRECERRGDGARAARFAFWLAQGLFERGDPVLAGSWLGRAQQLLDDGGLDCVERGYLLIPAAIQCFARGELVEALAAFESACATAERFGDADLAAFGRMGCGQALVALGNIARATQVLDAAMVAVRSEDVSPVMSGLVYCGAIEACQEMFDLPRAREWTGALSRWCDSQRQLVPYRGQCLVHRAEIMERCGDWQGALVEAQYACERLAGTPAAGSAHYRLAELHRLRGALSEAEGAYRSASLAGHDPQPGLALLRLAQGRLSAAEAAIRRVVNETSGLFARARVLGAYVEITIAAGDVPSARAGADELAGIAAEAGRPQLRACAAYSTGAVLLAERRPAEALPQLRAAWRAWRDIESPYETARVRVLLGLACRALGDDDNAEMEFDAARLGFEQLGARTELSRLDAVTRDGRARTGGLTHREIEVLVLVAKGMTNRDIGSELVISEHTVARHLQNIFAKLGVNSRTAAISYAHEHGVLSLHGQF